MAFIILSPTFSLFATNILKFSTLIYALAWLHGMPLMGCQNMAWKTFHSIYFDTFGWCCNFRDMRIDCCAFSHWEDCTLCISAIAIMEKICPLASLF